MERLRVMVSRWSGLFRRRALDADLDRELRAHLEALTEENIRRGMNEREARYAARSEFGGLEQMKESYREQLAREVRDLEVVYLRGAFELIQERMNGRRHRFMPAALLRSQFDALEPPQQAIEVDVSAPVESSISKIKKQLQRA